MTKPKEKATYDLDIFEGVDITLSNGFFANIPKVVEIFKDVSLILQDRENNEITDEQFVKLVRISFDKNTTKINQ